MNETLRSFEVRAPTGGAGALVTRTSARHRSPPGTQAELAMRSQLSAQLRHWAAQSFII